MIVIPVECGQQKILAAISTGTLITTCDASLLDEMSRHVRDVPQMQGGKTVDTPMHLSKEIKAAGMAIGPRHVLIEDLGNVKKQTGIAVKMRIGLDVLRDYALYVHSDSGEVVFAKNVMNSGAIGEKHDLLMDEFGRPYILIAFGQDRRLMRLQSEFRDSLTMSDVAFQQLVDSRSIKLSGKQVLLGIDRKPADVGIAKVSVAAGKTVPVAVYPDDDLKVGFRFLQRFNWVFDLSGRALYLTPSRYFASEEHWDGRGVSYVPDALLVTIGGIAPGSLAERAGLKAGDKFEQIDGDGMLLASPFEVHARLRAFRTEPLVVTVRRNGEKLRYELPP